MTIKHKVVINVSNPKGRKANVLRGADVKLPTRLLRFLFGDFTQGRCESLQAWLPGNGAGVMRAKSRNEK